MIFLTEALSRSVAFQSAPDINVALVESHESTTV